MLFIAYSPPPLQRFFKVPSSKWVMILQTFQWEKRTTGCKFFPSRAQWRQHASSSCQCTKERCQTAHGIIFQVLWCRVTKTWSPQCSKQEQQYCHLLHRVVAKIKWDIKQGALSIKPGTQKLSIILLSSWKKTNNSWSLGGQPVLTGHQESSPWRLPNPSISKMSCNMSWRVSTHGIHSKSHCMLSSWVWNSSWEIYQACEREISPKWAGESNETERNEAKQWLKTCQDLVYFFFHQHVLFSLIGVSHTLSKGTGNSVFRYSLKARPNI